MVDTRALSRSGKSILHIDPNNYYGGPDAALSLQEIEEWASAHHNVPSHSLFSHAYATALIENSSSDVPKDPKISSSRAYSIALSPQIIHTRSALLARLVSSRLFRQLEFQAVGSFYIFKPIAAFTEGNSQIGELVRIPSTREDVFASSTISARAKRQLMKFLKFVLDFENERHMKTWQPYRDLPFSEFLGKNFQLEGDLQQYILTLTLSLDVSSLSTHEGLSIINRHLSSMGAFGPGFAAVYPKWGGIGEIVQAACRACAVGGATYMLGTSIKTETTSKAEGEIELELSSGVAIKTRLLVRETDQVPSDGQRLRKLVAVVSSSLTPLFEAIIEGSPSPAVAFVAFPQGSVPCASELASFPHPIFAGVHSSQTEECPPGQCKCFFIHNIIYKGTS